MRCLIATCLVLVATLGSWPAHPQDLARGARNYQLVLTGKIKLESLTAEQQREVLIVHKRAQSKRIASSGSRDCREARTAAKSAAEELADYARKLRNCAEADDLTDDCDFEFRRTKSAHEDYEEAVSKVASEC